MKITKKEKAHLFRDYSKIISAAHVRDLKATGLDIIEAGREGPYVYDTEGKRYIDCNSSGATFFLGRRRAEVLAELEGAMTETDQGNFPMISREKAALAAALADFVPGNLDCAVFSVGRGEAFDFACKLARGYTGRKGLVSVEGSWFGQTGFALSLSERKDKVAFGPLIPEVRILPYGDLDALRAAVTERTAAVFLEPVQAENHCRTLEAGRLREVRAICRRAGALLVLDETQTALGRTGRRFAFEHAGVTPDVVILGESLGAGIFPIAATVFTQEINTFLNDHPLIHLSTFGGSDLGCRVACKVLEVCRETRPWEGALSMGEKLKIGIEGIVEKHGKTILSVEGAGLLLSMDLETPAKAKAFCKNLSKAGVLASPGAVADHTVILRPSLTLSGEDVEAILEAVASAASKKAKAKKAPAKKAKSKKAAKKKSPKPDTTEL